MTISIGIHKLKMASQRKLRDLKGVRGGLYRIGQLQARAAFAADAIADFLRLRIHRNGSRPSITRVFLARNTSRGRHISNREQIEEVCSRFGFDIVDTDDMELDSQIELFSGARYVIGVHGAGLTNIIFRRGGRLSLLELFPADQIPPHYYWLSLMFGFEYSALLGQEGPGPAFEIDPYLLQDKIKALLN
jgi:Glycosyltransferase 61